MVRDHWPAWAKDYVGLPYQKGGRTRAGVDCWGLVQLIWREVFGVQPPAYEGVVWDDKDKEARLRSAADIASAINENLAAFPEVERGAEREGDGILLRMRGVPMHMGIVVLPGWMIHCHETADACLEQYTGLPWGGPDPRTSRVIGFYRPNSASYANA